MRIRTVTVGMGFLLWSLLTSCSDGDRGPPSVSSLHYVEVTTGTNVGESFDNRDEGYYRAPDSARVIGNARYSPLGLENIVIGSRVWTRRDAGWSATTADFDCYTALDKIKWIIAHGGQHEGATDEVEGPTTAGEPTWRYRWAYEDAGRLLISVSERSLGDSPSEIEALARIRETLTDLAGVTEIVVGKNTGRVYSLLYTQDGPRFSRRTEIVVDQYDEPIEIAPPANVSPPTEEPPASRDCPEPPGEFPWILAAIAAVLGPLVFLGASSFVWPRRL